MMTEKETTEILSESPLWALLSLDEKIEALAYALENINKTFPAPKENAQ